MASRLRNQCCQTLQTARQCSPMCQLESQQLKASCLDPGLSGYENVMGVQLQQRKAEWQWQSDNSSVSYSVYIYFKCYSYIYMYSYSISALSQSQIYKRRWTGA